MTPTLGRLRRIDLRAAWKNEASHFTPWLAEPDNLALLGEAIDLELELQAQEQAVGPFRADLLCRDTDDDSLVLIENQLERTDHNHLGQLLTYAAGLEAVTLVWIAERFTDEHRAAMDWLNEVTHERVNLFGLEIELWQIGDSPPAPKFNVVVQPNQWTRSVKHAAEGTAASTPVGELQVAYWSSFGAYLEANERPFKPPKPYPSNWAGWGLGRSGVHLLAFVNATNVAIGLDIETRAHPTWFARLAAHRAAIDGAAGAPMEWVEKPGHKNSTVRLRLDLDLREPSNWPEAHRWTLERLLRLRDVLRPIVQDLSDDA